MPLASFITFLERVLSFLSPNPLSAHRPSDGHTLKCTQTLRWTHPYVLTDPLMDTPLSAHRPSDGRTLKCTQTLRWTVTVTANAFDIWDE